MRDTCYLKEHIFVEVRVFQYFLLDHSVSQYIRTIFKGVAFFRTHLESHITDRNKEVNFCICSCIWYI